jgi:hypothetical protein
MVQLAPDYSAEYWLLNSVANFNLGNIPVAEASATRGLRLDGTHQVPQLEYVYAMILARRGNYRAAVVHLQTYLRLSPRSDDAQRAQSQLVEFQKLAGPSDTASR